MIITKWVSCEEAHVECDSGVYCCSMCMTTIAILIDEDEVLDEIEKRLIAEDKAYADWLTNELAKDVKEVSFEDLLNRPVSMMDECKTIYAADTNLIECVNGTENVVKFVR